MIVRTSVFLALILAGGCRGSSEERSGNGDGPSPEAPAPDPRPAIVFLGTSLTAGYGLGDAGLAYPALIQARLDAAGRPFRVVNAVLSGESSAGALDRIDWLLFRNRVAVLVVEVGANDGLGGEAPDSVRARTPRSVGRARTVDPPPRLVLAGMEALPNLGADYRRRFRAIYPALARDNDAALIPFLLEDVAGVDSLNQQDGIHPTAQGQRVVAENVWRVLERVTR